MIDDFILEMEEKLNVIQKKDMIIIQNYLLKIQNIM